MIAYLARRVAWAAVTVPLVLLIVFGIFYLVPTGNIAARFAGKAPTPTELHEVTVHLGLLLPWWQQFGRFLERFITGDSYGWPGLGYSYQYGVPVLSEVTEAAPRTLSLIVGAAVIWLAVGVLVGTAAALRPRSFVDRAGMVLALIGMSAPVFWLGLMALWLLWQKAHIGSGTGYAPLSQGVGAWAGHLILPWIVLATLFMAVYARMTRNSLLETLNEDFIRTARAKGMGTTRIVVKHGLRVSVTMLATMFGMDLALLVSGAVITESVFNIQGLGWLAVQAALNQDLPTIIGVVVISATAVVLMSLMVDIMYVFLDPRVRYR